MSKCIDGFLLPIHPDNLDEYRRLAALSSTIWKEHGALEYIEAVGNDLKAEWGRNAAIACLAPVEVRAFNQ